VSLVYQTSFGHNLFGFISGFTKELLVYFSLSFTFETDSDCFIITD